MKGANIYARHGFRVLPIRAGGKVPLLKDWTNTASCDPDVVAKWAEEYPEANVGALTGEKFFVLDVDPRNGGDSTLLALEEEHGQLPDTALQKTPSGGYHYLFKMVPGITNSAGKLGPGLDVRGVGGQIVVAPSSTEVGSYVWERMPFDEGSIAEAPAWLIEMLASKVHTEVDKSMADGRGFFPPASPAVLEQARQMLALHGPAIEGQGGDLHTFQAAALLVHDFALTSEEAWPLIQEWNEDCQPPWDEEDLRSKLEGGDKYGTAAYGCKRTLDIVVTARKWILDWQTKGGDEEEMFEVIERCRALPFDDPAKRQLILEELKAATGLNTTALALPKAYLRAPSTSVVQTSSLNLDVSSTGVPRPNLNNAFTVLESEKPDVYFDEFLGRRLYEGREWSDADDGEFCLHLQRDIGINQIPTKIAAEAVWVYARRKRVDSMQEWLQGLKWDGKSRNETFFHEALGASDNEYTRAASSNFLKTLVARPLRPGCKVDTMVVLEGTQGIYKSTAMRVLAGTPYFAEAAESPHSKDFFMALEGKLIVEVAELDSFARADVTAIKRVLSCAVDRYRPPYARAVQDWPRRGIFVGTTNRSDWSKDDTGARRFWPIVCTRINLKYIAEQREQFFAEAVARLNAGEKWYEMPVEATLAEQEARFSPDPWEEILAEQLAGENRVKMTDLLQYKLQLNVAQCGKKEEMRVAQVMRRLNWLPRQERIKGEKTRVWTKLF